MDWCGQVKILSLCAKKYIFVVVEYYSRFTWTMIIKYKSEAVDMKDNDTLLELFKLQNHEVSSNEAEVNMDSDVSDLSPSEEVKENVQPTMGPGPF